MEGWKTEVGGERKEEEEKMRILISQRRCRWWHGIRKESGNGGGSISKYIHLYLPSLPLLFLFALCHQHIGCFSPPPLVSSLAIHIFQLTTVLFQM